VIAKKARSFVSASLALLFSSAFGSALSAQNVTPETLSDEQVVASLKKGIDWAFNARDNNGLWETHVWAHGGHTYDGGHTALMLYSLLHVGESLKDDARLGPKAKELQPAIKRTIAIGNTDLSYLKAAQIMALSNVRANDEVTKALRVQTNPLVNAIVPNVGYIYRYSEARTRPNDWDNSATQLSCLAASCAAEAGVEIPLGYWAVQDAYWRKRQHQDGSWGYGSHKFADMQSHSLSAAGVASLFITNEQKPTRLSLTAVPDKNIEAGLKWLDANIDMANQQFGGEPSGNWVFYAVERVSMFTGRKYIGGKDWYRVGAAKLINMQENDGSWPQGFVYQDNRGGLVPTALNLMFLARGRNPTAFMKLEYPGNTWNARPYDIAHLTKWMGKEYERALNWQTVSFNDDPEEWLDCPVLVITGSADPKFTDEQLKKLRAFVEGGGTIFSTSDGPTAAFDKAMMNYATKITDNQYEPRELPLEHPIYSCWGKVKTNIKLTALSNGSRELWVHSNYDLGAVWERRAYASKDFFFLPANIFMYASGGGDALQPRLRSLKVLPVAAPANNIKVTRIQYAGNWNPEPGAWNRFAKIMARDAGVGVNIEVVKVDDLDPAKNPVAHITGTEGFKLAETAVTKLKDYVKNGGTLIIDPTGGADRAMNGSQELIAKILPEGVALEGIKLDSDVITGAAAGGTKIAEVNARLNVLSRSRKGDRVLGAKVNGRYAVLYTPLDMTSGLLGTQTMGIAGMTPQTSIDLMRNFITYGTANKPAEGAAANK
jgi:hypothetical protein